jgi:hypothetical protein
MPFGMGPAGWLVMWPYMAQWMQYWNPWYGQNVPYYGYGYAYPYAPMTKEQELNMLKNQMKVLENELKQIKSRMTELQKKN